ncbi:MAG TPA: hypothetical protein VGA08_00170 [Candidatus Saccharimonadales bacterium]
MNSRLAAKHQETADVWSYFFSKPPAYSFTAGDYAELEIDYAPQGGRRWFSLASAPHENHLQITTRLPHPRSEFKHHLANLSPGQSVNISPPMGNFNLPKLASPVLLVAGGIGITPYRSILLSIKHDASYPMDLIKLVYSARPGNFLFNESINFIGDGLKLSPSARFRLDVKKLTALVPDMAQRIIYLSGPEEMMDKLHKELLEAGIKYSNQRLSFFPNYSSF